MIGAEHGLSGFGSGLLVFLGMFLPLAWAWVGLTLYLDRFETGGIGQRFLTLGFMAAVAVMAACGGDGIGGPAWPGFALAYAAARLLTLAAWVHAAAFNPPFRPVARRYTVGFSIAITLVVVSGFVTPPLRHGLLAAVLAVEPATPWVSRGSMAALPPVNGTKHPERFGLFMIVVLGETVTGVVAALHAPDGVPGLHFLARAALGVVLGFTVWWLYFDTVARTGRCDRALRGPTPGPTATSSCTPRWRSSASASTTRRTRPPGVRPARRPPGGRRLPRRVPCRPRGGGGAAAAAGRWLGRGTPAPEGGDRRTLALLALAPLAPRPSSPCSSFPCS